MTIALLVGLLLGPPACQTAPEATATRIQAVLDTPEYATARWGIRVVDAATGKTVFERSPEELFRPASVTKLFSCAAALAELGADHRFVTPVVRQGDVDDRGTLKGNLILVAQGDLSLGGRTGPDGSLLFENNDHSYAGPLSRSTIVPADPLAGLDHLAREVVAAGIKAIEGDVFVDDRLFGHARSTGSGPGRVTPIVINDNIVDVVVSPGAAQGEPATVKLIPETSFVSFDAQVETAEAGSRKRVVVTNAGPRRFVVRGKIAAGDKTSYHTYEVEEPALFARALFIETLRRRGVRVSASPLLENPGSELPAAADVATLPVVAKYTSPPFSEYLRVILKVSQNLHASTLPLLIAARHGKRTLDDGLALEGKALAALGVDISRISFGGGAGGSPADLVSPRATVDLLKAMAARPDFPAFEAALPILGRDGTLATSVSSDSPARGHARAKTGTFYVSDGLSGKTILTSKALAGYMETAARRKLIFAFFLNDVPLRVENGDTGAATAEAGRLLGRLCEVLYADEPARSAEPDDDRPTPANEAAPEARPAASSP
jgi:D-alanyl-D-alanine carboxypeptidase/D-alanyl-D-alanine-endopeptidase (penicillin-binding protein 4)